MDETLINETIASVEPMLIKLARKWTREPRVPFDDLLNIGREATVNAIMTFDMDRGAKLTSHIYNCANRAMMLFWQSNLYQLHSTPYHQKDDLELIKKQESRMVSLNKVNGFGQDGESKTLADIVGSDRRIDKSPRTPMEEVCENEQTALLMEEINKLTPREQYIIKECNMYMGSKTLEEIGNELGVTKQCISQNVKKIVEKLKVRLEGVLC
jgi:RNA polymerase sigma factor (sigma-70 family)